jgi:hypothetical protein
MKKIILGITAVSGIFLFFQLGTKKQELNIEDLQKEVEKDIRVIIKQVKNKIHKDTH